MQSGHDLPSEHRETNVFYTRISEYYDDIPVTKEIPKHGSVDLLEEEDSYLYGKLSKKEFEAILEAYESQQELPSLRDKAVDCPTVIGGNFSKLLHSKSGLHHLGSTDYLVKELKIKDHNRFSFLGGISIFAAKPGEDLQGVKANYAQNHVNKLSIRAIEHAEKKEFDIAKCLVDESIKLSPENPYALYARGVLQAGTNKHSDAIRDFKKSLKLGHEEPHLVKKSLSESLYELAIREYNREEWQGALDLFRESISNNHDNQGSIIHKSLCEDKMRNFTPFSRSRRR